MAFTFQINDNVKFNHDKYLLDIDNIVGLEKFRIRYIGYPTIAIYDRIKGD